MKVCGYEVTEQQERACLASMVGIFKFDDLKCAAIIAGVPETWTANGSTRNEDLPDLVARHLIQRQLGRGAIRQDGHLYIAVKQSST